MVHDGFHDHGFFQPEHRAHQIIVSFGEVFVRPEMGGIAVAGFAGIDYGQQFGFADAAFGARCTAWRVTMTGRLKRALYTGAM
jgi:hypothetical protein